MTELTTIPHIELLGIIGCIFIASVAAWSSAAVNMRLRMIERDIDDLYDEVRAVRETQAYYASQGVASAPALREPVLSVNRPAAPSRRSPALARPTQPALLTPLSQQFAPAQMSRSEHSDDRFAFAGQRPNVALLAEQLAGQSPEQMDAVLTPALDLGAGISTLGAGRQESRLLRWMNGVTGQFSTARQ